MTRKVKKATKAPAKAVGGRFEMRLDERDRVAFEAAAEAQRLSLAAWLRIAGLEKLKRDKGV